MPPQQYRIAKGTAEKLGAQYDGRGVNFAVHAPHAEKIELCLFDDAGKSELARIPLPEKTGDIWHGYIKGLKPGQIYGLRAHGPDAPEQGHRFNPQKLLLDPYATEIMGKVTWGDNLLHPDQDSANATVKARVTAPLPSLKTPKPNISNSARIICELHPKGFTKLNQKIPAEKRGTYAGLAHPAAIDHLKDLGITTVELLPVMAKVDEQKLNAAGLTNYWGYNTLAYFAPEPSYAQQNARQEFRDMVEAFHTAGMEVVLDVVFNHTGESGAKGPNLSMRGLDNAGYYKLDKADQSKYIDHTGCRNTVDVTYPAARRLVLDSLRHWVTEYGVDGFRFDLAPALARGPSGFDACSEFFKEIAADPVLSQTCLIAEPWDIGPDGYQLGQFPSGWQEWNDKFRDDVRKFWRGDQHSAAAMATRLAGSSPSFDKAGRRPADSINMVTCHDGFTLDDLVSYNAKHNAANQENNKDGTDQNYSQNNGLEGKTTDKAILDMRDQQKRNMLASLFLAQGTPMILAGDEHGNSQQGNNNAYCQDNETSWLNWDDITARGKKMARFVKKLLAFRQEHPALQAEDFLHGEKTDAHGVADLSWISDQGQPRGPSDWQNNNCFGMLLNDAAIPGSTKKERLLSVFNNAAKPAAFTLPKLAAGSTWVRAIDTARPEAAPEQHRPGTSCTIAKKSVAVFVQKIAP